MVVCRFVGRRCLRLASAARRAKKALGERGPLPSSSIASKSRLFSNSSWFTHTCSIRSEVALVLLAVLKNYLNLSPGNATAWSQRKPRWVMQENDNRTEHVNILKHRYGPGCILGTVSLGMLSISVLVKQDKMMIPPLPPQPSLHHLSKWMSNCLQDGSVKINTRNWLTVQLMLYKTQATDWHNTRCGPAYLLQSLGNMFAFEETEK